MQGSVQAKSKKDAKQLAAAALLEVMLEHVPFQDLLYKSDKQQNYKDIQVITLAVPTMCHAMAQALKPAGINKICVLMLLSSDLRQSSFIPPLWTA